MAPLPDTLMSLIHHALRVRTSDLASRTIDNVLTPRSPASSAKPSSTDLRHPFGVGAVPAKDFNNKFYLALFALLGAAAALAAIWFFFWAKNGGFHFQEGDWDDYKSTVLRRKGPDGKTLSNATKSTKLGGGSVVHGQKWKEKSVSGHSYGYSEGSLSSFDDPKQEMEMTPRRTGVGAFMAGARPKPSHNDRERDPELAEYRHERPAKVGGLNRQHDGSHFDYSNTGSDVSGRPLVPRGATASKDTKKREKAERAAREKAQKEHMKSLKASAKAAEKAAKTAAKTQGRGGARDTRVQSHDFAAVPNSSNPNTPERRHAPPGAYTDDDETPSHEGSHSYYASYRPVSGTSPAGSPQGGHASRYRDRRPETGSPTKPRGAAHRSGHSGGHSSPSTSDVGTKTYSHHIPGLSKGSSEIGVDESVSQVGARRSYQVPPGGFRRSGLGGAGVRRRDSLSDSD